MGTVYCCPVGQQGYCSCAFGFNFFSLFVQLSGDLILPSLLLSTTQILENVVMVSALLPRLSDLSLAMVNIDNGTISSIEFPIVSTVAGDTYLSDQLRQKYSDRPFVWENRVQVGKGCELWNSRYHHPAAVLRIRCLFIAIDESFLTQTHAPGAENFQGRLHDISLATNVR
jgi:hypothetical protein